MTAALVPVFQVEQEDENYADYWARVNYSSAESAVRFVLTHHKDEARWTVTVQQEDGGYGEFADVMDTDITADQAAMFLALLAPVTGAR